MTLQELTQQFATPDNIYKPVQIIHSGFPTDSEEIKKYIDTAIENDYGGFVVNVYIKSWGQADDECYEDYLNNPERFAELKRFIEACVSRGLKIWLYDEAGFPSGSAGRHVYNSNNDFHVRGIIHQYIETSSGVGSVELCEGDVLCAKAFPLVRKEKQGVECDELQDLFVVDGAGAVNVEIKDVAVHYNLPELDNGQKWLVSVVIAKKLNWIAMAGVPYVDLLRRDVTDKFIEVTYQRYYDYLGADIFSHIEAIFTDEPGVATHGCSSIFNESYPVAAWTVDFARLFMEEYNYPIESNAFAVFLNFKDDNNYKKVRVDFWRLISKLYRDNYFKPIYEWCEQHNTEFTGHMYGEETLSMQIGLNGELFGLMKYMQMPGVDRLSATEPQDILPEKCASSAAHMYGHRRTMSESSFHFEHSWWHTEADVTDMINSSSYQYALGINNIASYYPMHIEGRATFQEYIARVATAITDGQHMAPVLLHIPMAGGFERYAPVHYKYWNVGKQSVSPFINSSEKALESAFADTMQTLLDNNYDFDLIDEDAFDEVEVQNGVISTKYESFQCLVYIDYGSITPNALKFYKKVLKNGGKIIAVKIDNENVSNETAQMFLENRQSMDVCFASLCPHSVEMYADKTLNILSDKPVMLRSNMIDDGIIHFLHNRFYSPVNVKISKLSCESIGLLDPASGNIETVKVVNGEIAFTLDAKKGKMLTFKR